MGNLLDTIKVRETAVLLNEKNKGNQGLSIWLHGGLFKDLRAKRKALRGNEKYRVEPKRLEGRH